MTDIPALPCDRPALFESAVCTRCAGSGDDGVTSAYGTRCFRCSGRGETMTKRGAEAERFYRELLGKRAGELRPGDRIRGPLRPGCPDDGWYVVESVEVCEQTCTRGGKSVTCSAVTIECDGYCYISAPPDSIHRIVVTDEQKASALAKALAHQETLTKQGRPRKRNPR